MSALDEQIERSRKVIRQHESAGQTIERDREEARLSGLVFARQLQGGVDDQCVHPIHRVAGIDENGKTLWRCVECQAVS